MKTENNAKTKDNKDNKNNNSKPNWIRLSVWHYLHVWMYSMCVCPCMLCTCVSLNASVCICMCTRVQTPAPNTFTKSISILVIDWPGLSRSPNNAIFMVNFRLMLCFFSHSWTWDQKQVEGNTKTNGLLIMYPHNKICRAAMIVCPKYLTSCWWQEFCTFFFLKYTLFYISTHTPCTMESVHQKSFPNSFAICMAQLLTSWSSNETGILSFELFFFSSANFDPLCWADRPVPYLLPLSPCSILGYWSDFNS